MNDADKMREAFEAWAKVFYQECRMTIHPKTHYLKAGEYVLPYYESAWEAWQAASAQQNERIKDLEAQIEHQRAMLTSRSY